MTPKTGECASETSAPETVTRDMVKMADEATRGPVPHLIVSSDVSGMDVGLSTTTTEM